MSHEAQMLARAIRDHALHLHGALTPRVRRGIVRKLSPLSVELVDADVLIDADEMILGTWLRNYDRQYGIAAGDTLFLYPIENGDWLAFEAATNNDLDPLPEYVDYVPEWTAISTPPDYGNSSVVARYAQNGPNVHAYGRIVFGSSANFGSGGWRFTLPVPARSSGYLVGSALMYRSSTSATVQAIAFSTTPTLHQFAFSATYLGANTDTGVSSPWPWAAGDQLFWNLAFEAAA